METKFEKPALHIQLDSRIDSNSVNSIEEQIEKALALYKPENLILDARDLAYISSAGLRLFLKLQKRFSEMKVIKVCKEVQEIFEMTGFDQILTIEKALREISVEGKELIGKGGYGDVYRIDPETVVKVYRVGAKDVIEQEIAHAKQAFVHGIPTAISYDTVKVGDQYGSVFELIQSDTLARILMENPDQTGLYAKKIYDLLQTMAATDISDFISIRANEYYIQALLPLKEHLTDREWSRLISLIKSIPQRNTMLHSDAHAKNIMVQNGELLLIDMDEIMIGHPIYDLADIYYMYAFISKRANGQAITGMSAVLCDQFNEKILDLCLKDLNEKEKEKVIKALEMLGRIRVSSGTLPYLSRLDPEASKKKLSDLVEDLRKHVLPYQKEFEEGLALFPPYEKA